MDKASSLQLVSRGRTLATTQLRGNLQVVREDTRRHTPPPPPVRAQVS